MNRLRGGRGRLLGGVPAVLTLAILALGAPAEGARPAGPAPSPRRDAAMTYDAARNQIVLFGGYGVGASGSTTALGDTWTWNGKSWTEHQPPVLPSPSPRFGAAMAYDAARQRVVLFGGTDGGSVLGDTWTWDGSQWRPAASGVPPARFEAAMTYDGQRLVLFGGTDDLNPQRGDTWTWDGVWSPPPVNTSPTARSGPSFIRRPQDNTAVLFGGRSAAGFMGDTWVWNGIDWTQKVPNESPPARTDHAMAEASADGSAVLFGGRDAFQLLSDTWTWDGITWTRQRARGSPSPRAGANLAHQGGGQTSVLFGGYSRIDGSGLLNDMWEWDGVRFRWRRL